MRNNLFILIILILISFGLAGAAPLDEIKALRSDINKTNNKISKYNLQIKRKKLKKAKGLKYIQELKRSIKAKEAKIKELKEELYMQPVPPEPIAATIAPSVEVYAPSERAVVAPQPAIETKRGWQIKSGLGGGAPMVHLEYINPLFFIGAGYGVGNKYTLTGAACGRIFTLRDVYYWGLTINYMDYSVRVKNIGGMASIVSKGSHIGAGILLGRDFGKLFSQLGYNTAGGLLAEIGYKF